MGKSVRSKAGRTFSFEWLGATMIQHDKNFWFAVMGAALVKVLIVEGFTDKWPIAITKASLRIGAGVFTAIVFTDPVLDWNQLNPVVYKAPVAALLCILGHDLIRLVVNLIPQDWRGIKDIWNTWRGKK